MFQIDRSIKKYAKALKNKRPRAAAVFFIARNLKLKISLILVISILFIGCGRKEFTEECIGILPLGLESAEFDLINKVDTMLKSKYGCSTVILNPHNLPESAWYKPRNRYKANLLLEHLLVIKPDSITRILALTSKDISVKTVKHSDWGIMGLARTPGTVCVVSTFRLGHNEVLLNERLMKVCTHELGHTFGLKHCSRDMNCVMNNARGSIKTVDREVNDYCVACKKDME